jgi:hypothetical protein
MKKNEKKIIFKENSKVSKYIVDIPKPATNSVPKWYKEQKLFSNGTNDYMKGKSARSEGTYKLCVPLVDAITAGYMFTTTADIVVTNISDSGYTPFIEWQIEWTPVDLQKELSLGNFPIPENHNPTPFRWHSEWQVVTPKGYSLWITHPANRYDLPFTTLTGFVDTDVHPNKILFPFFIKDGFEGIIPEGTPIAQAIPIKRDSWLSERQSFDLDSEFYNKNIMKINFVRSYKNKFWSKKEYK